MNPMTPIPQSTPNWEPKSYLSTKEALINFYKQIKVTPEPTRDEKTAEELLRRLNNSETEVFLQEVSNTSQTDLKKKLCQFWMGNTPIRESAQELGDAQLEVELEHQLKKDIVMTELHRRSE